MATGPRDGERAAAYVPAGSFVPHSSPERERMTVYRRLAWIGHMGPVRTVLSWEQRPTGRAWRGVVRGILLVVLVAAMQTGLKAADPKPGDAVNIMWRFDGNGRFPNLHPPAEWRRDKNILWQTPVEIGGYSSPIVVRDKVFVTAEMGSLVCLDLADGKVLWKKDLFSRDSKDIPAD